VRGPTGSSELTADRVVLTVPAYTAAELLRPLDAALADELAAVRYAAVSVVQLGFPTGLEAPPVEGFGVLAPHAERRSVLGIIYTSSVFPWRAPNGQQLLTCLVGGARHPELAALPDTDLVALATKEVRELVGVSASPSLSVVFRWARAIPQYEIGHAAGLSRLDQRLAAFRGLKLAGHAYRGVGLNDTVRDTESLAEQLH
jgi:protoporphyrinogen/coproporphyrinogen III oxidase